MSSALGMASSSYALPVAKDAPYELIAGRNVFKLVPSPSAVPPVSPVQPTPTKAMPKVIVTGITDVCGRRQVLAEISEPGRPTLKPVLAEGEEAGLVRVLRIDVGRGMVEVRIHGEASTLALQSSSVPTAPPPVRR